MSKKKHRRNTSNDGIPLIWIIIGAVLVVGLAVAVWLNVREEPAPTQQIGIPANLPARLDRNWMPTSVPNWVSGDFFVENEYGSVVVQSSVQNWQMDKALLEELVYAHGQDITKPIIIRLIPQQTVVRNPNASTGISAGNFEDGLFGLTVSSDTEVVIYLPMGWVENIQPGDTWYSDYNLPDIHSTAEMYGTLNALHELLVHGFLRAANENPVGDQEHIAQTFEHKMFLELNSYNRPLFRQQ